MPDDMKIPEPWSCRDCVHIRRCQGLFGVKGHETTCDFSPSRFRLDTIGTLCRLVDEAGLTMTLYDKPVTAQELKAFAVNEVNNRIQRAIVESRQEGDK